MINLKKLLAVSLPVILSATYAHAAELKVSYFTDYSLTFEGKGFSSDAVILTVIPADEEYTENSAYAVIRECNPENGNFVLKMAYG